MWCGVVSWLMMMNIVNSISVHKGEEIVQRRLSLNIIESDRQKYQDLLAKSSGIKKEIAKLSPLLPEESASTRIKMLNAELQETIHESLTLISQSSITAQGASAKAIERARKREDVRRMEADKEKRRVEDMKYVENMRKMEIVQKMVVELQSRAVLHGLDNAASNRVNDMLDEYRIMEAEYIFNGSDIQAAQAQRRLIEKFIGDSQAIEVTSKQRQKELLERNIQEFAARGISAMCKSEMKVLDEMLAKYREYGLKYIEITNSKDPTSLAEEITAVRKAKQSQKLSIEKFIGTTKSSSNCVPSQRLWH